MQTHGGNHFRVNPIAEYEKGKQRVDTHIEGSGHCKLGKQEKQCEEAGRRGFHKASHTIGYNFHSHSYHGDNSGGLTVKNIGGGKSSVQLTEGNVQLKFICCEWTAKGD